LTDRDRRGAPAAKPLAGVRAVELGVWVAGPAVGGILADWGADVIKIETPAGDPMRSLYGLIAGGRAPKNPPFDLDNRGKRSIVLDLAEPAGKGMAALEALLQRADVFVTNLRPGALERLGLDPPAATARHPRLVYASVTGYGLDGPDRDTPGYDVGAFWARTGCADLYTLGDAPPPAIRGGFGDHVTAVAAVAAILAALYERESTGRGRLVETSLLRAGAYSIGWDLVTQLGFGKLIGPIPRTEYVQPTVNCYRAGDGRWFWLIGLEAERHIGPLLEAIEKPELVRDPRFATARDRRKNSAAFIAILDEVFATRTREEWAARFAECGVWWQPVQTPAEVVADPQAEAAGVWVEVEGGERSVAPPAGFGERGVVAGPVPALGEHTAEILSELGLG